MTALSFDFQGETLLALPTGALFWPAQGVLCVSDLHLGKSDRMARRGGPLLPPYDSIETLDRLAGDVAAMAPKTVICLGDSFDDLTAAETLDAALRDRLISVMAGRRWVWISGNHDPGPIDLGGTHLADYRQGPLVFRHIAENPASGEVSGHYHPKARLVLRGRSLSRPCFLFDSDRLILPAFGAYTGGLFCDRPELSTLLAKGAEAILLGTPPIRLPMPR